VVVMELRDWGFGREMFEVAEPFKVADVQAQPMSEFPDGVDGGDGPKGSGGDGLHSGRGGDPGSDGDLRFALFPGAIDGLVVAQEGEDGAAGGADLAGEAFNVTAGDGAQPSPVAAERVGGAIDELFDDGLALQEGAGESADEQRFGEARRQRSAPTSLTWREVICVGAQGASRDECPVCDDALGYPQRGKDEPCRLGALRRRSMITAGCWMAFKRDSTASRSGAVVSVLR